MAKDVSRSLERWSNLGLLALAALVLVGLWSVFLVWTRGERDQTVVVETERLMRSSRVFTSGLDHLVGESRLVLELLVNHSSVDPRLAPETSPDFLTLVKTVRSHGDGELNLRAVDQEGNLYSFGGEAGPKISVADRDYYRLQRPYPGVGLFIDKPILSRETGLWGLVLSQSLPPTTGHLAVLHINIGFETIDRLVASLTDTPGERVSVYRNDGTLLYRHPRSGEFPADAQPVPLATIQALGTDEGLLRGPVLQAFRKAQEAPFWVVISRPAETLTRNGEQWFGQQIVWMVSLTLGILAALTGVLALQGQMRRLRLTQEALARVDPLTGLLNRRAFLERCAQERTRAERLGLPLSLVILDLDHFKLVNDRFGHQVGDLALKGFGAALVRLLRATDLVARIGGEEFAVLLPGTDGPRGLETCERLRAEIETVILPEGHLTASLGVALWDRAETFDAWYHRADQALYRAKDNGRNRVEAADQGNSPLSHATQIPL